MKIPFEKLVHVNVVVEDLERSARSFTKAYGIEEWRVNDLDSETLSDVKTRGYVSDGSFRVATGEAPTPAGPMRFRLIRPVEGWSTYQEFLITRKEGVHSVATAEIDTDELSSLSEWLAAEGVGQAQSYRLGRKSFVTLDTRETLGGFFVELVVSHGEDGEQLQGETWNLAEEVPADGPLLPLAGDRQHFGVVVYDLMGRIEDWSRLTGVTSWDFSNWHASPDSLEEPTYLGEPVDHAYFTAMVQFDELLGFEIIQPTHGPSHYKEDYRDHLGEGIHHLNTSFFGTSDMYQKAAADLEEAGAPMVMSGGIGKGFLNFYYHDTRDMLAGFVTEVLHPGPKIADGPINMQRAMSATMER